MHGVRSFQKFLKKYSEPSLRSLIKKLQHPFRQYRPFGGFRLNWLVFGTSHVWDIAPTELLTEKLYLRAAPYPPNQPNKSKCIYHPEAVDVCTIHYAALKKEYKIKDLPTSDFRINHYWSGPEKKLMGKRKFSKEQLAAFAAECSIEDKTIFQSLKQMKVNLFDHPSNKISGSKIKAFQIFGGKRAHTQLLRSDLVTSNLTSLNEEKGVNNAADCLFLVITRSPYEWIKSGYLASPKQGELISFLKEVPEGSHISHLLELRNEENKKLIEIKESAKNYVCIDYDLLYQYPEECIEYLATKYNLKKSKTFCQLHNNHTTRKTFSLSNEELEWINHRLDWNTEQGSRLFFFRYEPLLLTCTIIRLAPSIFDDKKSTPP